MGDTQDFSIGGFELPLCLCKQQRDKNGALLPQHFSAAPLKIRCRPLKIECNIEFQYKMLALKKSF
jgi:hypothetical protein